MAPYNAAFGARFDELFRDAATEIKQFAKSLEELGGNILSTVDGVEVTVEHVAALEASELLKSDYSTALEKFRRVSKLKKELERRPPIRRAKLTPDVRPSAHVIPMRSGSGAAAAAAPARQYTPSAVTAQQLSLEEARLIRVIESIRIFVRVADPKFRKVVPMRYFNLTLSTAEVEAYCADYLEEKSDRADVGRTLLRIVAVVARMGTETEEMRRSHASPSLWKLRADALVALLEIGRALNEQTTKVIAAQEGNGKSDQVASLKASLQKLRDRADLVVKMLAHPGSKGVRSVAEPSPLFIKQKSHGARHLHLAVETKKATLARGLYKTAKTMLIDVELLLMHRRIRLHDDRPLREILHFQ